jgi:hypothetical protein
MVNPQFNYGPQPSLSYQPVYNPYANNFPVPIQQQHQDANNNYIGGYEQIQNGPTYGQQQYGPQYGVQYAPPQYINNNQNYYGQPQYNQLTGYNVNNQI